VLANIAICENPDQLVKSVNVLDALYWISETWEDVKSETIQKCFARSGFKFYERFTAQDTDDIKDLQSLVNLITSELGQETIKVEEYLDAEN